MGIDTDLLKKAKEAILYNKLVGDVSFSDEEYENLVEYTRVYSLSYLHGIGSFLGGDESIHFIALVEIAKHWKRIDDDENDEKGFWQFVFKTLIGIDGYETRLYQSFTDIIKALGHAKKIFFVDHGKKFWATLMMHAFAPIRSIYAFLDLNYNIYRNDLDFNYTDSDKGICELATIRFCEILQSSVGDDKTISIGSNTYGVRIGLRNLALNSETQNEFITLMHRTLEIINKLFHKQKCEPKSYYEKIIFDWWQNKLAEVMSDRKTTGNKSMPAVSKQNISVKFMRENDKVFLIIPPIRLDEKETNVILSVYVGIDDKGKLSEELFTKIGELTITTKETHIDLDEILEGENRIILRVEISENGSIIFNKKIDKEFILFDDESELQSQIHKENNYFLYSLDISELNTPENIFAIGNNVYNICPKAGETLSGEDRKVFFIDKSSIGTNQTDLSFLGNLPYCEWCLDDIVCAVFSRSIGLLIPNDISLNGLVLFVDNNRMIIDGLPFTEGNNNKLFDITSQIPINEPVKIVVFSHLKDKSLLDNTIILFPKLDIGFSKPLYYGDDEKKITLTIGEESKELMWDNSQSEVIYPYNSGNLIISIPYLRWRINGKEWHNESYNYIQWYKPDFHSGSILEIDSPYDLGKVILIAIVAEKAESLDQNSSGKFDIGEFIHKQENVGEIFFLLKIPEKIPMGLFIVSTKEHFINIPIVYSNSKVFWKPEDTFTGDKSREFQITFKRTGEDMQSVKGLNCNDEEIEGLEEGLYKIKITSQDKNMFKKEIIVFYEGDFIVGRKEKFRFEKKQLQIISAGTELNMCENTEIYWKPLESQYFIDNLQFLEIDNEECYIGNLYALTYLNNKVYLNTMINEKNTYDKINPVRVLIVTNNTLELIAGHDKDDLNNYLGTLSYDVKRHSLSNINACAEKAKEYPCINYLKYKEIDYV
ncbi:MAG: hypothetical protein BWX72_01636 [Firmicutes bacterium ADurb.Bin080]|nr:MAG: hypothetical protein BWX72_01636 [Firmicutes bacterium ADurb.Bin080]